MPFNEKTYAIVIVHPDGSKHLFGRVRRSPKGDVYAMWAEDESPLNLGVGSNLHASYHASGRVHSKSCNIAAIANQRQFPDGGFEGTEPIESANADRGLSSTLPVLLGDFDDLLEINYGQIVPTRKPSITVGLCEPRISPMRQTGHDRVIAEKIFKDDVPWIIISLVEPPTRL